MDKGSKMNYPLNLKQKALFSFETLGNSNSATQCHFQEDMDLETLKNFERSRDKDME
jgi:hypothetical protein